MSFKQFLSERSGKIDKSLVNNNTRRVGLPVIGNNGKEISGSLVIEPNVYIIKTTDSSTPYKIIQINLVTLETSEVSLTRSALRDITKFK